MTHCTALPCPALHCIDTWVLVQANMLRSFNRFTDALVHGACKNRPKSWRGLLFGITLFHAVIQVHPRGPEGV
eukprot:654970-Prorocentrum_minimum.AAC.3